MFDPDKLDLNAAGAKEAKRIADNTDYSEAFVKTKKSTRSYDN